MPATAPILPAAYGLPECAMLGQAARTDDDGNTWRLLTATGVAPTPAVFLQSLERPTAWRSVPHHTFVAAVRSCGAFSPKPFLAPAQPLDVTVNGTTKVLTFTPARASAPDIIAHLLLGA